MCNVVFCFFWFPQGFRDLWSKPKKRIEKKRNSTDYVGPRGSHRATVLRVLFFFLGVSGHFGVPFCFVGEVLLFGDVSVPNECCDISV